MSSQRSKKLHVEQSKFEKERTRIYEVAVHDVRRMIETMAPDDHLMSHIYRRLARAVTDAYAVHVPTWTPPPEPEEP